MKLNRDNAGRTIEAAEGQVESICLASCRKILAQIARVRDALFEEARRALPEQVNLLRLALNEAEAAAWETMFPHLVFPELATEKVQAVAAWNTHQQAVRRFSAPYALAA